MQRQGYYKKSKGICNGKDVEKYLEEQNYEEVDSKERSVKNIRKKRGHLIRDEINCLNQML